MSINVYIDGSCTNNGKVNATAGYGVYFGENDERNEYARVEGKQSNNTAELTGAIRCMEILEKDVDKKINIYTDSEYVIKCLTTYGSKLESNNWKTSENKIPPNLELIKKAYGLFKNSHNMNLLHIEAHTNKTDVHSIGNQNADRLACLATGQVEKKDENIRIDINYNDKEEAKTLGARWNISKKYWYYTDDISEDNKKKLENLTKKFATVSFNQGDKPSVPENKKYIVVNFSKKELAKKYGARWDPSVKSWYYTDSTSQENVAKLLDLR